LFLFKTQEKPEGPVFSERAKLEERKRIYEMEIAGKTKSPRKVPTGKDLLEQEAKMIEERERG
jgi:hypothetical protein